MHHFPTDQIYSIIMPCQFLGNQIHAIKQVDIWPWSLEYSAILVKYSASIIIPVTLLGTFLFLLIIFHVTVVFQSTPPTVACSPDCF